jgi:hypothetical protein
MKKANPISNFDKEILKTLREEINAALATVAEKYELASLECGNIGYNETEINIKVQGKVSKKHNKFLQRLDLVNSSALGYSENIVGLECVIDGKKFTVSGIDFAKKFPIQIRDAAGKSYSAPNTRQLNFPNNKNITWGFKDVVVDGPKTKK